MRWPTQLSFARRWIDARTGLLSATLVGTLAFYLVYGGGSYSPAMIGFALNMAGKLLVGISAMDGLTHSKAAQDHFAVLSLTLLTRCYVSARTRQAIIRIQHALSLQTQ